MYMLQLTVRAGAEVVEFGPAINIVKLIKKSQHRLGAFLADRDSSTCLFSVFEDTTELLSIQVERKVPFNDLMVRLGVMAPGLLDDDDDDDDDGTL